MYTFGVANTLCVRVTQWSFIISQVVDICPLLVSHIYNVKC